VSGWLVNNFTLAEIKVLRLKQRVATRDQIYNGLFNVTTLQEAIEALQSRNALYNTSVGMLWSIVHNFTKAHVYWPGIYIEPKHPTYFAQYGLTFDSVFDILESYGYALKGQAAKDANIYLECFETTWLKAAAEKTDMKLIFLVEAPTKPCEDTLKPYGEYMTKAGFDELSQFVFGLGPLKRYLYPFDTQCVPSR
jgi:glycerophosphoryl diester phosphodiesterase